MKVYVLLLIALFPLIAGAQEGPLALFIKGSDRVVSTKDSADFVRMVHVDTTKNIFVVAEYYLNGKIKLKGEATRVLPRVNYQGTVLEFDSLGRKQTISNYVDGELYGAFFSYYGNGKIREQLEYVDPPKTNIPGRYSKFYKVIYYADSLGKVMVENGTGEVVDFGGFKERGVVTGGLRSGKWSGRSDDGGLFNEEYDKGVLLSGESTLSDGRRLRYTAVEVAPAYSGGLEKLAKAVVKGVNPNNVQDFTGRVYASFTVESNGKLSSIVIQRAPNRGLERNIIMLLQKQTWEPAMIHGFPVRTTVTLPISF